jgi:hypothetical protein
MKTMVYDNRLFWQVTPESAIRPHNDRIEVLTWKEDGEVQFKTRTDKPQFLDTLRAMFEKEGLV